MVLRIEEEGARRHGVRPADCPELIGRHMLIDLPTNIDLHLLLVLNRSFLGITIGKALIELLSFISHLI